jgi:hypothetical protein
LQKQENDISFVCFQGKSQWVKYAVMNHFVSLVMAVITVIALAMLYRQVAVLFAGFIVTGTPDAPELSGTAIY